jgi:hypothetical protein
VRLYRALLYLYPASFRAEYEREMLAIFVKRHQRSPSLSAKAMLWLDTVIDVVSDAPAIHWDILRQDVRLAARAHLRRDCDCRGGIGATTAALRLPITC